jgi:serine/threonine protein kinase
MGTVYEAVDQRLNSIVAIKETHLTTEDARRAFEREASLLANLRHRSLPGVIDHFSENESQYLVMQFIPGNDLAQMLEARQVPFALTEVLAWGDEMLRTLEYLHGHNPPILHRDIKPSNLKLTAEGELFLLDFGLAKGAAGQMPTLLTSRSIKGYTPVYSPLEQIHGGGTDPRSDLYAVGATLYHLMTGMAPVDAPARFLALDDEQPDPLLPVDEVNPGIPHLIAVALSSAMAMNRRHRPGSAAAMRRMLSEASGQSAPPATENHLQRTEPQIPPTVPAAPVHIPPTQPSTPIQPTITTTPDVLRQTVSSVASDRQPRPQWRKPLFAIVFSMVILAIASWLVAPRLMSWMKTASNSTVSATDTPSLNRKDNPVAELTPTPTPTPELAKVRLRLITAGGSGCSTYSDLRVTLVTQNQTFKATTNADGFAAFEGVPCGGDARITVPGMPLTLKPGRTFSVTRNLKCGGGEIYLGSYSDLTGTVMSEREAGACYSGR